MLNALILRIFRGKWGSILPMILRAIAEGKFGEGPKKVYWFMAGYKTASGTVLTVLGIGLRAVCAPEAEWACSSSNFLIVLGGILWQVGLVDGGTRAPWPQGTPKEDRQP